MSERIPIVQTLQISVHKDKKSTKKPFSKEKPKIFLVVIKLVFKSNCKRFRQSTIREYSNLELETHMKKLIQLNEASKPIKKNEIKRNKTEVLASLFHLCLNSN